MWSLLRILFSPASLWNEHSSTFKESFVMSKLTLKGWIHALKGGSTVSKLMTLWFYARHSWQTMCIKCCAMFTSNDLQMRRTSQKGCILLTMKHCLNIDPFMYDIWTKAWYKCVQYLLEKSSAPLWKECNTFWRLWNISRYVDSLTCGPCIGMRILA